MASDVIRIPMNVTPVDFDPRRDLPAGFFDFYLPLHREFTSRRDELVARRAGVLARSQRGAPPDHLSASEATEAPWRIALPDWCQDQRNQMTGPADDGELVVKMLNSGAPGVMLDLEDSIANTWDHLLLGIENILKALYGELSYVDRKRDRTVGINDSPTVVFTRARGLHLGQAGVIVAEPTSASLFDVAMVVYQADVARLKHPLCFYIPKSESADEALWWNDVFKAVSRFKGLPDDYIKCMALVEAHSMAFQMEEFIFNLQDHLIGLNLGRWDYMASLIHFNLNDPNWVLPDRNTIPHNVPFFQNLRELIPEICHKRGALAIGGMTALYPSRTDPELNARALKVLEEDKRNEALSLMDGAWTGHPDQNKIAVDQFPEPNQLKARPESTERYPDLRPTPEGVGKRTLAGTRAAIRTVIRYRAGVLEGRGASLLDGYMEDLATDRIYRLMIAQRLRHSKQVPIVDDDGKPVEHDWPTIRRLFDEELNRILTELPAGTDQSAVDTFREAKTMAEGLVFSGQFDPV